jgi:hypothetical protein
MREDAFSLQLGNEVRVYSALKSGALSLRRFRSATSPCERRAAQYVSIESPPLI